MAMLLQRSLQREGYVVAVVHDGESALTAIDRHRPDAIVMDVMMPKLDGFQVMERLRNLNVRIPTILLTAKHTSHDIVTGLDLGADDYLTKPFDLAVLFARLRAIVRRPLASVRGPLCVGDLLLHFETHEMERAGQRSALTPLEFTLLHGLMQRVGRVVRKEELIKIGWGNDEAFQEATLYVFIRVLRGKMHALGSPDILHTVRGVGYVLRPVAEV